MARYCYHSFCVCEKNMLRTDGQIFMTFKENVVCPEEMINIWVCDYGYVGQSDFGHNSKTVPSPKAQEFETFNPYLSIRFRFGLVQLKHMFLIDILFAEIFLCSQIKYQTYSKPFSDFQLKFKSQWLFL